MYYCTCIEKSCVPTVRNKIRVSFAWILLFLGVGEGKIFSLSVPYRLMSTFSYCCCRYIFILLHVGCACSSGALLCKVNDYQVSFLKVFLMALDFMMSKY